MTRIVSTFSIVARDRTTGDLGVAVQSKFLAAGAVVPWARAGVGAVATQAAAKVGYGPDGLELMAQGASAEETVEALTSGDPGREHRQVGVVGADGRAASFTGEGCFDWAGGKAGDSYTAQGNILAGPGVVEAMAGAFEGTAGALSGRLVAALDAGQEAGGDPRGKQSAALLVVREGGGYGGDNDRLVDLRVDDHPDPIVELADVVDPAQLRDGVGVLVDPEVQLGVGLGADDVDRRALAAPAVAADPAHALSPLRAPGVMLGLRRPSRRSRGRRDQRVA